MLLMLLISARLLFNLIEPVRHLEMLQSSITVPLTPGDRRKLLPVIRLLGPLQMKQSKSLQPLPASWNNDGIQRLYM